MFDFKIYVRLLLFFWNFSFIPLIFSKAYCLSLCERIGKVRKAAINTTTKAMRDNSDTISPSGSGSDAEKIEMARKSVNKTFFHGSLIS